MVGMAWQECLIVDPSPHNRPIIDCCPGWQFRKDPDVVARVLAEFDPSGTQEATRHQVVQLR